jgi:hypothetical protein
MINLPLLQHQLSHHLPFIKTIYSFIKERENSNSAQCCIFEKYFYAKHIPSSNQPMVQSTFKVGIPFSEEKKRIKGNEEIAMKSISICKQDLVCGLTAIFQ